MPESVPDDTPKTTRPELSEDMQRALDLAEKRRANRQRNAKRTKQGRTWSRRFRNAARRDRENLT